MPTQPPIQRKIIHCDCDCFYASIEMLDNPKLRNKPIAVGGKSERRGVIATCNYEAREFGVHSAMPSSQALRLCPNLIIVPPNMGRYKEASVQITEIFKRYTDIIEPLSLDEAYLDVSDSPHYQGSATRIAQAIRTAVKEEVGITISAGIAPNKFIAKIASDWQKPDGLTVILPKQVDDFVLKLPVTKLFGVGKVTAKKMHSLGIHHGSDLRKHDISWLIQHFGSFGPRLHELSQGIDNRAVQTKRVRKSISVERTYETDLASWEDCEHEIDQLWPRLEERIDNSKRREDIKGIVGKIRFHNFDSHTIENGQTAQSKDAYKQMLQELWLRYKLPVRLLGIGVKLKQAQQAQIELFE